MSTTYLVQGCGVSLICQAGPSMVEWIRYMVERGAAPTVERLGTPIN